MALGSEVGELLEPFRWLSEKESSSMSKRSIDHVRDEMGDVFICLLNLARKLDVDVLQAARQKIEKNRMKYPAQSINAKKHQR